MNERINRNGVSENISDRVGAARVKGSVVSQQRPNLWNDFQSRAKRSGTNFSNTTEASRVYQLFKAGNFENMAQQLDLSSPVNRGMLWSRIGSGNAKKIAANRGLTALENTPGGKLFDNWGYVNSPARWDDLGSPLWESLSKEYARRLRGSVTAVVNKNKSLGSFIKEELNVIRDIGKANVTFERLDMK